MPVGEDDGERRALNEAQGIIDFGPVQQPWLLKIPLMQQSVLFAAIRAPDGLRKDHPIKVLMRWYRRCIMLSAFDRRALADPFEEGGGSFTGPFTEFHAAEIFGTWFSEGNNRMLAREWIADPWALFDRTREMYLRHVDEMPHHFQLHFMHAAQIIGVHHPVSHTREWWNKFYLMIVNDAHLQPETPQAMNLRLSDNSDE